MFKHILGSRQSTPFHYFSLGVAACNMSISQSLAAAAKFNFPSPFPRLYCSFLSAVSRLPSAEWIQSIFMSHTQTQKKKKMAKRSENFPTCVGSFLVERREKNVEENSFKVVGKKKRGAKWQVAGNNLCMCGWTMGLERGLWTQSTLGSTLHLLWQSRMRDLKAEECIRKCLSRGGQKSKNKTKSMPTAAGSKKILWWM